MIETFSQRPCLRTGKGFSHALGPLWLRNRPLSGSLWDEGTYSKGWGDCVSFQSHALFPLSPSLPCHFRLKVCEWIWYTQALDLRFSLVLTLIKLPTFSAAFGNLLLLSDSVSPSGEKKKRMWWLKKEKRRIWWFKKTRNLCLPQSLFELRL